MRDEERGVFLPSCLVTFCRVSCLLRGRQAYLLDPPSLTRHRPEKLKMSFRGNVCTELPLQRLSSSLGGLRASSLMFDGEMLR